MGKITYDRGTTYTIIHVYQKNGEDSTDGTTLFFTVKPTEYDSSADDSTAIIKKTIAMSGARTVFTIDPSDIEDSVVPGEFFYDIKVKETSSPLVIYPADSGKFILTATSTNRES